MDDEWEWINSKYAPGTIHLWQQYPQPKAIGLPNKRIRASVRPSPDDDGKWLARPAAPYPNQHEWTTFDTKEEAMFWVQTIVQLGETD